VFLNSSPASARDGAFLCLPAVVKCSREIATVRYCKRMKPLVGPGYSQLFFLEHPVIFARGICDIGLYNFANYAALYFDRMPTLLHGNLVE